VVFWNKKKVGQQMKRSASMSMWEAFASGLGGTSKLSVCRTPVVRKQYNHDEDTGDELFGWEVVAKIHFDREIKALRTLGYSKHFPALAVFPEESCKPEHTPHVLFMEFCGEPLTRSNEPADWKEQLHEITNAMRAHDIFHNDMHEKNFCVTTDGVMVLVDFGWSTNVMPGHPFFNLNKNDIDGATGFRNCIENMLKRVSEKTENYSSELYKHVALFKIKSIEEELEIRLNQKN
jgi:RIO-like serine/threonine protein kinase